MDVARRAAVLAGAIVEDFLKDFVPDPIEAPFPLLAVAIYGIEDESGRILNYVEVIIPTYSDLSFRDHFQMGQKTFQVLCTTFAYYILHVL
jgi:hypothetical protein